jgi:hypothetical protein
MVQKQTGDFAAKSSLSTPAERFLAQVLTQAFDDDIRSAEDFLEEFSPLEVMQALDAETELRTEILIKGVGLHERIARKKTAESAAEDLSLALDEGVTSPSDILALFSVEERVKLLDHARLFAFAIDPDFFKSNRTQAAFDRMLFLLEAAIEEGLITLVDFADAIGVDTITSSLAEAELRKIVESALQLGKSGSAFSLDQLLEVVPLPELIKNLPLEEIWSSVVLRKVAEPSGFVSKGSLRPPRAKPAPAKTNGAETKSVRPKEPPPKPARAAAPASGRPPVDSMADTGDDEDAARKRVTERLAGIKRLPPRHGDLSTQILFEIDSMYADLLAATSDDAREEAIRDSFPNEQHMATALLALIELLEPGFDVSDPEISKADVDSLLNVFMLEEREQRERVSGSQRPPSQRPPAPSSGMAPPPPPPPAKRSVPPPLPRNSGNPMPPPLPSAADKGR